jgi:ARG and Rhodanese-Phosphatase-superfamily-associated Protein domain
VKAADTVIDAVQRVEFGPLTAFRNLTLLALSTTDERESDYLTLDEALAQGSVHIVEVSEGGHVPELKIVNDGELPVLLLDGEELLGAKQNRVVNLTILVPAQQTFVIPVSCVESGRWHHVSRDFVAAPRAQFAEGRAAKMRQVTSAMQAGGSRSSDQQQVWSLIAEKSARLGARSDTSAMSAMFDTFHVSLEEFVAAFTPVRQQVGAVFFVNSRATGLELFDAPRTWLRLAPKLIRSYALDALDHDHEPVRPSAAADATVLIGNLISSQASVFPAVGEGEDVRIDGAGVLAGALVASGRAIHLSAFPVESAATSNRNKGRRPQTRPNGAL